MQLNWKIFCYRKNIFSSKDLLSYCNTPLSPYSNTLFLNEASSDSLSVFSTPSKSIEIVLGSNFEIRLFDWREQGTLALILEKRAVNSIKAKLGGDRILILENTDWQVEVTFYTELERLQFVEMMKGGVETQIRKLYFLIRLQKRDRGYSKEKILDFFQKLLASEIVSSYE